MGRRGAVLGRLRMRCTVVCDMCGWVCVDGWQASVAVGSAVGEVLNAWRAVPVGQLAGEALLQAAHAQAEAGPYQQ